MHQVGGSCGNSKLLGGGDGDNEELGGLLDEEEDILDERPGYQPERWVRHGNYKVPANKKQPRKY